MTQALRSGAVGVAAEKMLPPAIKKLVREKMGVAANLAGTVVRPINGILSNLIPMLESEEVVGTFDNILTPDDTGLDVAIPITTEISKYWYEPKIPFGMAGFSIWAWQYYLALNNMKLSESPSDNKAPRLSYYKDGENDIFAIRGTDGFEDLINDLEIGVFGKYSPLVTKKLKIYEEFINKNSRGGKIVVVGHSLGSLEANMLAEKLKDRDIDVIGYGHPVIKPHPKATVYSLKSDPLYSPSGVDNHKILIKPKIKGSFGAAFTEQHSITNYF